jgi:transcription initiation factor TFIID TATA-box-binding protein
VRKIMAKTAIVNVVATAALDQELGFSEIREQKWVFHDFDVYGGRVAYLKMPCMEGKISLFPSGKMISIGTKSEKKAYSELRIAMEYLVKKGYVKSVKLRPKTQNIVVTVNFDTGVDLEKLAEDSSSIYEPDQFPGAILRIEAPLKASVLIFASGKAVITGLTSSKQIEQIVSRLQDLISRFSER